MIQFCDNDVPVLWTRFMDKHHVVRVRKPPGFGLKYLFWSPQTRLEIVTRSPSKISTDFMLINVETPSPNVVTGWATFLAYTSNTISSTSG